MAFEFLIAIKRGAHVAVWLIARGNCSIDRGNCSIVQDLFYLLRPESARVADFTARLASRLDLPEPPGLCCAEFTAVPSQGWRLRLTSDARSAGEIGA